MKTDVNIIVGKLTVEDFGSLFSVSALEWYDCVQSQRQQAQASVDLPQGGLDSLLYVEEFIDKVKDWNENSPDIVKQQRAATVHHHCSTSCLISQFALNIIMA